MSEDQACCKPQPRGAGASGAIYGMGVIGAAVYFVQASTGFWGGALGILKAFFWPAFAVYKLFLGWGL